VRKFIGLAILTLSVCVLAAGCGVKQPSTPVAPVGAIPVDLREANYEALDAALKERKGNVILVDFWATWCPPCVKKFPHLVETHKKYADKGLACMSVSLDMNGPRGATDKNEVLDFLKKREASFPNFLLIEEAKDADRISQRFGMGDSIPFMALFDKSGKRVWDSEQKNLSDKELDKLIETELAK